MELSGKRACGRPRSRVPPRGCSASGDSISPRGAPRFDTSLWHSEPALRLYVGDIGRPSTGRLRAARWPRQAGAQLGDGEPLQLGLGRMGRPQHHGLDAARAIDGDDLGVGAEARDLEVDFAWWGCGVFSHGWSSLPSEPLANHVAMRREYSRPRDG